MISLSGRWTERGAEADQTIIGKLKEAQQAVSLLGRPRGGPREISLFIAEYAIQFPEVRIVVSPEEMCKVLQVISSCYDYWRKHPVNAKQLKQAQLLDEIRQVHTQSQYRYGTELTFQSSCHGDPDR